MVRVGGLAYSIKINEKIGRRISNLTHLQSGELIEPQKAYVVAGWASINEGVEGPPIYDVVTNYIKGEKHIKLELNNKIRVIRE